jgi:hypothetical protein
LAYFIFYSSETEDTYVHLILVVNFNVYLFVQLCECIFPQRGKQLVCADWHRFVGIIEKLKLQRMLSGIERMSLVRQRI